MRRSRRWAVAAVCALAATLVAGCGNPGGVDGDLTDDWVKVGEPTIFVPTAGVCHKTGYAPSESRSGFNPVDCAEQHRAETFHVGTFTGAAASRSTPPTRTSSQQRAAYAECDRQATQYLGADFRNGRLWLGVVVPSSAGWSGGARWFRCDLYESPNVEDYADPVDRQGSLKGELSGSTPLRLGCYSVKAAASGAISAMDAVSCTKSHNSEFVGVHRAADSASYPRSDTAWQALHTGCRKQVARYAAVPDDKDLQFRTGTVVVPNLEDDWKAGNHGVRCYLYLKDGKFTKSLRGGGSKALPVR